MYENNDKPILSFSELIEKLQDSKFVNNLTNRIEKLNDEFNCDGMADYKYTEEHGLVQIEVIVAGHDPENIKVKYNDKTNKLRIVDDYRVKTLSPWYYKVLELEFKLPETTLHGTFNKKIENGVLTVTVQYSDAKDVEMCHEHEI